MPDGIDDWIVPAPAQPLAQAAAPAAATAHGADDWVTPPANHPTAEPTSTIASVAKQVPVGFNEVVANTAGAPVDAMTWLVNHIPGVDIKKPFAGSDAIKNAMGLVGINPDLQPANTTAEKIARGVGGGVGLMLAPETAVGGLSSAGVKVAPVVKSVLGAAESPASVAANAAIGGVAGGSGKIAAEAAPDEYKPIAELAGNLAGGGAAAVTGAGVAAIKPLMNSARDYVAPMMQSGQKRLAGNMLRDSATNPQAVRDALEQGAPDLVPGSKPTTFQATGDMGLGSLERDVAKNNPAEFNQRRAEQNVARTGALERMQQTGSPADVSNFLRTELRTIDDSTEHAVSSATQNAQRSAQELGGVRPPEAYGDTIREATRPDLDRATSAARDGVTAIGGANSPEAYGANLRGSLLEARNAAKQQERALWKAVDPDGTMSLRIDPLKQAAAEIETRLTPSAKPIAGEERNILDVVNNYRPVTPFNELTDLRSRISGEMRNELKTAGETAVYARLGKLRGAVEKTISDAVEQRVAQESEAVARGEISPEQTVAAMLQRAAQERDAWLASRATNARAGDGGGVGTSDSVGSSAVSPAPRAQGQGGVGFSAAEGGAGLPEAALQPNFDAAAAERLRAATAATRERKQTFDTGTNGAITKSAGMQGQFRAIDSAVPSTIFKPGPGGFQAVRAYTQGVGGNEAAVGALQDYAAASLRRAAERPDGTLDANRYAAWRRQHQDALRALPGLRERFDAAARLSEPLEAFRPVSPEVSASHVPESFFHAGTGGFEDVQQLRTLIGDERSRLILGDYAASRLRQAAVREDGTLDPTKFATWRRSHQDALRAFPELDGRFANAAKATEAIAEAAAVRKAALDAHQAGTFGRLIGVHDADDVTRIVGGIFGRDNANAEFKRLADATAGDQAARAGLRKAVADYVSKKFVSNTEAATSGADLIKADAFQTFIRDNAGVLSHVLNKDELESWQAIAADLKRANRSVTAVKLPGGSNTAQDTANANSTLLSKIIRYSAHSSIGAGVGSFLGPIGSLVGTIGGVATSAMRDAGLKKVDDLVKAAMLDPNVARILLTKSSARPDTGPALRLAAYLRRVSGQTLFGQDPRLEQRSDNGERNNPVKLQTSADLEHAADRTEDPSPAQAEAGNYRKRHLSWKGLNIAVETEAGRDRSGVSPDGTTWSTTMAHPYGYFKGTVGRDGDQVDVYVGPHPHVPRVFVFDQKDPASGKFDEHKVVLGARDLSEAQSIYDSGFSDGSAPTRRAGAKEMSIPELKTWLANGNLKKPVTPEMQTAAAEASKPPAVAPAPPPRRMTLQEMLQDPRSADELRKVVMA